MRGRSSACSSPPRSSSLIKASRDVSRTRDAIFAAHCSLVQVHTALRGAQSVVQQHAPAT